MKSDEKRRAIQRNADTLAKHGEDRVDFRVRRGIVNTVHWHRIGDSQSDLRYAIAVCDQPNALGEELRPSHQKQLHDAFGCDVAQNVENGVGIVTPCGQDEIVADDAENMRFQTRVTAQRDIERSAFGETEGAVYDKGDQGQQLVEIGPYCGGRRKIERARYAETDTKRGEAFGQTLRKRIKEDACVTGVFVNVCLCGAEAGKLGKQSRERCMIYALACVKVPAEKEERLFMP